MFLKLVINYLQLSGLLISAGNSFFCADKVKGRDGYTYLILNAVWCSTLETIIIKTQSHYAETTTVSGVATGEANIHSSYPKILWNFHARKLKKYGHTWMCHCCRFVGGKLGRYRGDFKWCLFTFERGSFVRVLKYCNLKDFHRHLHITLKIL